MKFYSKVFVLMSFTTALQAIANDRLSNRNHDRILVISGIEDTLKPVHMQSKTTEALSRYQFNPNDSVFTGMPELFRDLKSSHADVQFAYISEHTRESAQISNREFLGQFGFPLGSVHLRESAEMGILEYKIRTVSFLIQSLKPKSVLLIGNDGDLDPRAFTAIRSGLKNQLEAQKINLFTFVHSVGSRNTINSKLITASKFLTFASSLDLAQYFISNKLISKTQFATVVDKAGAEIKAELESDCNWTLGGFDCQMIPSVMSFPGWKNCSGYRAPRLSGLIISNELKTLNMQISEFCNSQMNL